MIHHTKVRIDAKNETLTEPPLLRHMARAPPLRTITL